MLVIIFLLAPSAPPQDLRQAAISSTSITMNWQPPPEDTRNGHIRHYLVFVIESETRRSFTLNSTTNNVRVENLHPFYTYSFSIAAVTVEAGPRSNISLQTQEASEYNIILIEHKVIDFNNKIL